jgi:hypothetical protein
MIVLGAVLMIVGLVVVLLLAVAVLKERTPAPPPDEADLAAPYREGLHAAIRMQGVAQDLEQQLYAEALRQAEAEAPQSHTTERP